MKKILIGLMMMTGISLSAQTLSNTDFENWSVVSVYSTDTIPNQWYGMYCNTVHPTADSYWGSYATRIQGYFMCGIAQGIMINGQQPANPWNAIEGGTPFTSKPATISGFYKYTDAGNDSAEVSVILKKFNTLTMKHDTVGIGIQALGASATYIPFTVNINYPLPSVTPDSIIIMFNSSKYYHYDTITYALPNLYIDRISIPQGLSTGITESPGGELHSNAYPNPSSGNVVIEMEGQADFNGLMLSLYDVNGKKVMEREITQNTIFLSGLSAGNYVYIINSSERMLSKGKVTVQ